MKKRLFCLFLLLCMTLCSTALANGWGAPGDTVDLFDGTDYNDYSVTAEDYSRKRDTVHLVVNTRYHQQLLVAEKPDKEWTIVYKSTKAVWQPGDAQVNTKWPETRQDDKGFTLLYEDESYRFENDHLVEAKYGSVTCTLQGDSYLVDDGDSTTLWHTLPLHVQDFNIRLMPRSAEEVTRMNRFYPSTRIMFNKSEMLTSNEKPAVYSAPTTESWRANNGKAYVSLRDPEGLYRFGIVENGWELIQYQVSLRTSRVGYIQSQETEISPAFDQGWHGIPVVTVANTYFTDDPEVSQFQQGQIPEGTCLILLSLWDNYYAYVDFAFEGKSARGFVPLRDLAIHEYTPELAAGRLPGRYACLRGGNTLSDTVEFREDGSFAQQDGRTGTWQITGGDTLQLTLTYQDGPSATMPFTLFTKGFSNGEGDYVRE